MAKGGARPGAGRPKARPEERSVTVSVSLSPTTLRLLDSYVAENGLTRSAAVERLLLSGLPPVAPASSKF